MTNAVPFLDHIAINTNWTLVMACMGACITALVAFINFRAKKRINDDDLRESSLFTELDDESDELSKKQETLKDTINKLTIEVEKMKVEMKSSTKTNDELRKDNRYIINRLDELLRQLKDLVNI